MSSEHGKKNKRPEVKLQPIANALSAVNHLVQTLCAEYKIPQDLPRAKGVLKRQLHAAKQEAHAKTIDELNDVNWEKLNKSPGYETIYKIIPDILVEHLLHPKCIAPLQQLARCFIAIGEFDKAKIFLQQALSLENNHDLTYSLLGEINMHQKTFFRAKHYFKSIGTISEEERVQLKLALDTCVIGELLQNEWKALDHPNVQGDYIFRTEMKEMVEKHLKKCDCSVQQEYEFTKSNRGELLTIFKDNHHAAKIIESIFQQVESLEQLAKPGHRF